MKKEAREVLAYLLEKQADLRHKRALMDEEIERLEGLIKMIDKIRDKK